MVCWCSHTGRWSQTLTRTPRNTLANVHRLAKAHSQAGKHNTNSQIPSQSHMHTRTKTRTRTLSLSLAYSQRGRDFFINFLRCEWKREVNKGGGEGGRLQGRRSVKAAECKYRSTNCRWDGCRCKCRFWVLVQEWGSTQMMGRSRNKQKEQKKANEGREWER